MNDFLWHETLDAPRSLLTGPDISVSVVEDPGVISLHTSSLNDAGIAAVFERYSIPPTPKISGIATFSHGLLLRRKGSGLWIIGSRSLVHALFQDFQKATEQSSTLVCDLTGHFAMLKLAGSAASEVLVKVCPIPLNVRDTEHCVSFRFLEAETILIPEKHGNTLCWQLLAARSEAPALAEWFAASAVLMPRIHL